MRINYEDLLVIMTTTVSTAPAATIATAPPTTTISDAATRTAAPADDVIVAIIAAFTTVAVPLLGSLHHQQIFSYDDSWFYWFPAFIVISPGPLKLDKYVKLCLPCLQFD